MKTIATSGRFGGGGSLGPKSRRKPMTARMDKPMDKPMAHPVYGTHKMTTRKKLHAEGMEKKAEQRELDRKWKKISDERLAEKNAKGRKRWAKHVAAENVSRGFTW